MSTSNYSIEYKFSALQTWLEGKYTLRERPLNSFKLVQLHDRKYGKRNRASEKC